MKPIDVARAALDASRRLVRDRRGAIAPMFAVAGMILLFAGGVGVDVARLMASRNSMQDALDATTLALGREPAGTPIATLNTKARAWMTANLTDKNLDPNAVTLTLTQGSGTLQLDATSAVSTTVTSIAGVTSLPFQAHSTVRWGLSHVELVLVLDNTGSMADDNKLQSLKDAATTLVNTLSTSAQQSGDPNALKVGVVPFSIAVNVGSTYRGSDWLTGVQPASYGADIFNTANVDRFTMLDRMNVTWGGCVEDRPMPYDVQETAPTSAIPNTMFVPFFAPDEPDTGQYSGVTKYGYGNDYMNDAAADSADVYNQTYSGVLGWKARQGNSAKYIAGHSPDRTGQAALSPYPVGPNSGCGIAPLLRMTTNMSAVTSELNQMVAYGNTHIPLGLVWGWHLLSPNAPFSDGKPYGTPNVVKIVVLVTDGANTYSTGANNEVCKQGGNLYYCNQLGGPTTNNSNYTGLGYIWQNRIARGNTANGNGDFSRPDLALNDRLGVLCANMLAQGITMYTVPLEVTDANIKSLLQGCASTPSNYLDVTSSSQLQGAFTNIAGSIGNLRVSH